MKFSKSDLVERSAARTGLSKKLTKHVIDDVFGDMADIIADGGTITIQGLFRLYIKEAQPRTFRKINTGELMEVGERNLPKAKYSKNLISKIK